MKGGSAHTHIHTHTMFKSVLADAFKDSVTDGI